MRILIQSPLNCYSGYGNDGIGMARALMRFGADVYLQPSHVSPPLPPEIAQLLTKRLEAPFDLTIVHIDPMQLEPTPGARKCSDVVIGWCMWEYTSLDNCKGRSTLRKRLRQFDALLAYDSVTLEAFRPYVEGACAGAVLQGGYWPEDWLPVERDWYSDRFGFCMVGALHERKDPFLSIQAFQELQDEVPDFANAELHLKGTQPTIPPMMEEVIPRLRIHTGTWPDEVLRAFYAKQHCLLAPSRGEGKNMPALEFMSTGGAVVATAWGGHSMWLSPDYAYPLDYTLAPIAGDLPNCKNARASKDHLKELMLQVYRNRGDARKKGELASSVIPALCSWEVVMERFFERLKDLIPGGQRLYDKARACRPPADSDMVLDLRV